VTWKDTLEIGLKEDAPFRRDHLPDSQKSKDGPATKVDDPTRSPEEPGARAAIAAAHVDVLPVTPVTPDPDDTLALPTTPTK
jgi:hypothetical protein